MASNMVAVAANRPHSTAHNTTALLTTNATSPTAQLALPLYRPRSGRNDQSVAWETQLKRVCKLIGIPYEEATKPPPDNTPHRYPTKSKEERDAAYAYELSEYQRKYTALHDIVEPSLQISGLHYHADRRKLDRFARDGLGDGAGLISWVRSFADVSDPTAQAKIQLDFQSARLKSGSNLYQLELHCAQMLERWLMLQHVDHSHPMSYYQQLLVSLPTEPDGAKLPQLRVWLAGKIEDMRLGDSVGMLDPDDGNMLLAIHAKNIGVPRGSAEDQKRSAFSLNVLEVEDINPNGLVDGSDSENDGDGALHALPGGRKTADRKPEKRLRVL